MTIRTFIGKPVKVEAILWDGHNFAEIQVFCNGLAHMKQGHLAIETTEGTSRAQIGDWIVRGTQGEFYPVKPEVMRDKYIIEELPDNAPIIAYTKGALVFCPPCGSRKLNTDPVFFNPHNEPLVAKCDTCGIEIA